MKKIAFYLPQFHSIPENNEWWGEGFTEWTNLKKSRPQYKGHQQPEKPLNENYYNLLNKDVQVWQSELALEYGIDGFCYYHYWFDGKLLLEKPMELMLNNNDVKIPFCICWANETWSRTWDGNDKEVLIEQNYSDSYEGWKKHFEYLLPFFKDKRYILVDNQPMMIIYKPHLIRKLPKLIAYWNKLAKENGFKGLYWGFQHYSAHGKNLEKMGFNFGIMFEPMYTVNELNIEIEKKGKFFYSLNHPKWFINNVKHKFFSMPLIFDYDEIWKKILLRQKVSDFKYFPGVFTSWDNTPRRGNKSVIFRGATPAKFYNYFNELYKVVSKNFDTGFIFINAWNEWAEGAHLEPDELNKYGYLEAVKKLRKDS